MKAQDLIDTISNVDESLIKDIKVFDVYEGDNIPENQKSIAISVTIQSSERTLNESDLEKINNLIIKTVEDKTGAKIRSWYLNEHYRQYKKFFNNCAHWSR